jgi:hypothetical protein
VGPRRVREADAHAPLATPQARRIRDVAVRGHGARVEGGADPAGGQVDRVARGGRALRAQPPLFVLNPRVLTEPPNPGARAVAPLISPVTVCMSAALCLICTSLGIGAAWHFLDRDRFRTIRCTLTSVHHVPVRTKKAALLV